MRTLLSALLICIFSLCASLSVQAQIDLDYYFLNKPSFDPAIPTPAEHLGYQVGDWHVEHTTLVNYMRVLAQVSPRITIEEYGRTYENRPLVLLTISSVQNQQNMAQIKKRHKQVSDPNQSNSITLANEPIVVWMGYSVHGNEPSGSNASLLMAYYLAAAQGAEIEEILSKTVVLLDPSINPDGLNRFASWVNTHKSKNLNADPSTREHNEAWPRGRTNHYWFDLNRDWMPVQHPESRGRMTKYHEWKPNVLTDHHEMGTNSTFFFQPGIPSRNHPLTPANTYVLTEKIAKYHSQLLDQAGSFYYTKESFDDFYFGKGSTFPDINGAVGILFEQASSRGHIQESENGDLSFAFTIRNQLITSLSTLKAGYELRNELLSHQRDFYQSAIKEADKDELKAYVFSAGKDKARVAHLVEMMSWHEINVYQLKSDLKANNKSFKAEESYVVPLNQSQYRLIKAMFEVRTSFTDSLFYDISAWTLPMAFNLDYAELKKDTFTGKELGEAVKGFPKPKGQLLGEQSNYAYLIEWDAYYAPKALFELQKKGLITKVATEAFTNSNGVRFEMGTILVPVQQQTVSSDEIYRWIKQVTERDGLITHAISSGWANEGVFLGSPAMVSLQKPEIMLLIDGGVSSYDAGEIWHLLDQRFDVDVALVAVSDFNRADLQRYNTIIMANGSYSDLNKDKLRMWIQQGGTVVAIQGASKWLADNKLSSATYKTIKQDSTKQKYYADLSNARGAQVIGGAIFKTQLDLTHPLAYGFRNKDLHVFRNNTLIMDVPKAPYSYPVRYTAEPLASGYISKPNLKVLANTPAVQVSSLGRGKIISFTDNPNFRAFWFGTNRLFMNSLFFAPIISANSTR